MSISVFCLLFLTTTNTVTQYNILLTWHGKNKNPRETFSAADMPSRFKVVGLLENRDMRMDESGESWGKAFTSSVAGKQRR